MREYTSEVLILHFCDEASNLNLKFLVAFAVEHNYVAINKLNVGRKTALSVLSEICSDPSRLL